MSWDFNLEKTKERYKKLQNLYLNEGLNADNFHCKHYENCSNSQKKDVVKQFSGGTCGLMPFYDAKYKETEIRILVIGKETGYMKNSKFGTSSNFDENTLNLLNCINWDKKNNHIKGTLITLQNIFNVFSDYIYSGYALSNVLRCAFQLQEKADNLSAVKDTNVMRRNCINYLVEEIKILEPTLIIVQGEWAIKGKETLLDLLQIKLSSQMECIMTNNNGKYGLYKFDKFMCVTSHHPAIFGNWVKNLAPDSLWPMINYLKINGILPNFLEDETLNYERKVKKTIDSIINELPSNDRLRKRKINQLEIF